VNTSSQSNRPAMILGIVRIAVFDLAAPLFIYSILRSNGWSQVSALILSGAAPAASVVISAIQHHRIELVGALVLAGIALSAIVGWDTGDPRLILAQDSILTGVLGVACLASLRTGRPLIFRLAVEFMGEDNPRGKEFASRWRHPGFRHAFRVITAVWGITYLAEAAARIVIVETLATGTALAVSKSMPYIVGAGLAAWQVSYGLRAKRRGDRPSTGDLPDPSPAVAKT
jgi:hypothetical protein